MLLNKHERLGALESVYSKIDKFMNKPILIQQRLRLTDRFGIEQEVRVYLCKEASLCKPTMMPSQHWTVSRPCSIVQMTTNLWAR